MKQRADAVGDFASTHDAVPENTQPIAGRVFAASSSAYLGVRTPTFGVGVGNLPRITGGTLADVRSPGVELDGTAATIENVQVAPVRLTASFSTTVESFSLIPGLDAALKIELRNTLCCQT